MSSKLETSWSVTFSDDASKKYEQQKGDMLAPGGGQLDGLDSRHIQKKPEMLYPVGLNLLEKVFLSLSAFSIRFRTHKNLSPN